MLLLVADQPFVTSRELDALRCAHAGGEGVAYVSAVGSRKGNPCLFGEACYEGLSALRGDEGARALFRSDPEMSVTPVRFDDPRLFDDVDTPEEFSRHEAAVMRWERELAAEGWKGEPR